MGRCSGVHARPGEAQWVPIDRFTHTRARHGARMARARATWAPGRFGPGLDWSGVRQVSANLNTTQIHRDIPSRLPPRLGRAGPPIQSNHPSIHPSIHPSHPSNPAHTPIHEPSIRTRPCAVHSHVCMCMGGSCMGHGAYMGSFSCEGWAYRIGCRGVHEPPKYGDSPTPVVGR
jgi:hypothetical protein